MGPVKIVVGLLVLVGATLICAVAPVGIAIKVGVILLAVGSLVAWELFENATLRAGASEKALTIGFESLPSDSPAALDFFRNFSLLAGPTRRSMGEKTEFLENYMNIMLSKSDGGHAIFDYYQLAQAQNDLDELDTSAATTVAVIKVARDDYPEIIITPGRHYDKVVSTRDLQTVAFPENPLFAAGYRVGGGDEWAIRSLVTVGAMEFLMKDQIWTIEMKGSWLAAYKAGVYSGVESLPVFAEEARAVLGLFAR